MDTQKEPVKSKAFKILNALKQQTDDVISDFWEKDDAWKNETFESCDVKIFHEFLQCTLSST